MALKFAPGWADIANRAIARLGTGPYLNDIEEASTLAGACRRAIPEALTWLLAQYDWSFAKARAELALLTVSPEWGYAYKYQLPTDMERLVEVYPVQDYRIEGTALLTDETAVFITYIARNELPSNYSNAFKIALSTRIAAILVTGVSGNDALGQRLFQESMMETDRAIASDAKNQYQDMAGAAWIDEVR